MPNPVYTPRVNNNDDVVRLTHLFVSPGAQVRRGEPIADVETDKATFTVEAEREGYLLGFGFEVGETIEVGSVLAWIGDAADEAIPAGKSGASAGSGDGEAASPTLKAILMLAEYGLSARDVPASGGRLSASDVQLYISQRSGGASRPSNGTRLQPARGDSAPPMPSEEGKLVALTPPEHGMLRTIAWHKSEAVPAYLEIPYDPAPWAEYAAAFQQKHRLLLNPLLALMARRLVDAGVDRPALNGTIVGEQRHLYAHVNLGFTVQAGSDLIAVVVRESETLDQLAFVQKLSELQRRAMRHTLRPEDISGATIGMSSMARWRVSRHVPVLLPHTTLMVAHTAASETVAYLGATYDHRSMHGAAVVQILQTLTVPPATMYPDNSDANPGHPESDSGESH